MNGELVKRQDRWDLYAEDGSKIGSSAPNPMKKLSVKNCEAVANGYDLDEVAKLSYECDPYIAEYLEQEFKRGFKKALEIIGNKKFSEEDIYNALDFARGNGKYRYEIMSDDDFIQSLQQTEWDVEVEMEQYVKYVPKSLATVYPTGGIRPKLDEDGCLILKRK